MKDGDEQVTSAAATGRPLGSVVAGVSLAADTGQVLAAAVTIARQTGARLVAVHAAEPAASLEELAERLLGEGRAEVQARLERVVAAQADPAGVAWEAQAFVGEPPHRAIIEAAGRCAPGLLIVGATTGSRRLGSTADRVVHRAWCPVLVVRGELALPPRRVIAPTDLSQLSGEGFRVGLQLVSDLSGGAPFAATALFAIGFLDPMAAERRREQISEEEMLARARQRLDTFVADYRPPAEVTVTPRVVLGPAREEILKAAQQEGADLVAMATHGRSGYQRLLLGNVAAGVAREATCSVLLLPPRAALQDALAEEVVTQAETRPAH